MAFGKSLELREIKRSEPVESTDDQDAKAVDSQLRRRLQRHLRRRNPEATQAFTRRPSGVPTGPGALTRYHVEVSDMPGIAPIFSLARPFPVRRPMDWSAHKAMAKVQIAPDEPPAETMSFRRRTHVYADQNETLRLTPRQRKRRQQKQNAAGLRQRRAAGLAA